MYGTPTTEAELAEYYRRTGLRPPPGSEARLAPTHPSTTGEGQLWTLTIPLRLVSESNQREHWARKAKRVKRQRQQTYLYCSGLYAAPCYPLTITITRIAPRALDTDNLASSCKAVQDGIADWLSGGPGLGQDRHPLLTWHYAQRTGKPKHYAVEITLERPHL